MSKILCITGRSAVGKSTLAHHLHRELGIETFSLGDYQREKFGRYGSPLEYHAKFGIRTTYYDLWEDYISKISECKLRDDVVVEGLYTYEFLMKLKKEFEKDNIYLIRILASKNMREKLFSFKTNLKKEDAIIQMAKMDKIKADVGLARLLRHADTMINNNADLDTFLRNGTDMAREFFQR